MSLVATSYEHKQVARIEVIRTEGNPSSCRVVQTVITTTTEPIYWEDGSVTEAGAERREEVYRKDHVFEQGINGAVFITVPIYGDMEVTLSTGEVRSFNFDAIENTDGSENGGDTVALEPWTDEQALDDFYADEGIVDPSAVGPEAVTAGMAAPFQSYYDSEYNERVVYIPFQHRDKIFVDILDENGGSVEMKEPIHWTASRGVLIDRNGGKELSTVVTIRMDSEVLNDESTTLQDNITLGSRRGQWSWKIDVGEPHLHHAASILIHDINDYNKTYGGSL